MTATPGEGADGAPSAEERLRVSEHRVALLLDRLPHVVLYETGGGREFVSANVERLLGYPPERFLDRAFFPSLIHPEDMAEARRRLEQWHRDGEPGVLTLEFRCRHADGREVRIQDHMVEVFPEGGTKYMSGVLVDVTEQRSLEARFRRSQKMEAVGLLAGGVAHEFNNLLTVILGYTDLVQATLREGTEAKENLDTVQAAARRAAALTRDLLAFSRRQFLRVEVVDAGALAREFAALMGPVMGEDHPVRCVVEHGVHLVRVDRNALRQALVNLCTNAREAMPGGGTIVLSVAPDGDDGVRISVEDSGYGMDEETSARAFEPFFTTRPGASGLGLAMVWGTVRQMDGRVEVRSEPGAGSRFDIYFPRVEGAPAAAPAPAPPGPGSKPVPSTDGRPGVVLLAEDDAALRGLAAAVLRGAGYEVIEASDGEEAVRLHARAGSVDLLVLDVVMPRMGGRETLDRVRLLDPSVPVLFISGYSQDHHQLIAVAEVADGEVLAKPFTPATLLERVGDALLRRGPGRSTPGSAPA